MLKNVQTSNAQAVCTALMRQANGTSRIMRMRSLTQALAIGVGAPVRAIAGSGRKRRSAPP